MSSARPKERLRSKRKRVRYILLGVGVLLLLFLGGGAYWALWQPWARIGDVSISGTSILLPSDIAGKVESILRTEHHITPNDSILFFSKTVIERKLKETFPRIESVSFSWNGVRDLTVRVVERNAYAAWCGNTRENPIECYYFDRTGFLFAPASLFDGYRLWYAPLAYEGNPLGNIVFTDGVVEKLDIMLTELSQKNIPISSVSIRFPDEVDLFFPNGGRVTYLFGEEAHVLQVLPPILEDTLPEKEFEYIDLRFGRKVYFKR